MIPLRVLLVTDRFWPVVDSNAFAIEQMCHALIRRGHLPRVLTRSCQKYWSPKLKLGEIDVDRLPYCPRSRLGNLRLVRQLSHWLESHRDEFDIVVVDPRCCLSVAAVQFAARHEFPICLWQVSPTDAASWSAAWNRLRRSLTTFHRQLLWVVTDEKIAQLLRGSGIESAQVCIHAPAIDCSSTLELTRAEARLALADQQPAFLVAPDESLVVSMGDWNSAIGAIELVDAWRWIRQSCPNSKLWLLGDGIAIPTIVEYIRTRQLSQDVIVAGCFDDWGDVMCASDLLIQTDASAAPPHATLSAMRFGVPVLAPSGQLLDEPRWGEAECGFSYVSGDPRLLARQVIELLQPCVARDDIRRRARLVVQEKHNLEQFALSLERIAYELVKCREKIQT